MFILGPTASGKSRLALELYQRGLCGGIVNADASQVYRQVSFGVASPSPDELSLAPHFLFSFVDCFVRQFNAAQYRSVVEVLLADASLWKSAPPLFVGGSLFYAKSLFFKLDDASSECLVEAKPRPEGISDWGYLGLLDPKRALEIHPNDTYRVERALQLYFKGGKLPSACKPQFNPVTDSAVVVWVDVPNDQLKEKIHKRIVHMLAFGWVEEVEGLIGTLFEDFAKNEGALGYQDVYQWIVGGKRDDAYPQLVKTLEAKTWDYVRRQRKFWRSFKRQLSEYPDRVKIVEVSGEGAEDLVSMVKDAL